MSYRHFIRPSSQGWTTGHWTQWAIDEGLLLSVRPELVDQVCRVCWGATGTRPEWRMAPTTTGGFSTLEEVETRWPTCPQCRGSHTLAGVVPISFSVHGRLESAIWRAKNDPAARWLNVPLASVLYSFLGRHWSCVEARFGRLDLVTGIPSHPASRGGWDHMDDMFSRVRTWPEPDRWALGLLSKSSVSAASTRRDGARDGLFQVADPGIVRGQRVLLIDDTFTSGGTMRSAALALAAAGALPPVALTIGRQVRANDFGKYLVDDVESRTPLFAVSDCAVHPY